MTENSSNISFRLTRASNFFLDKIIKHSAFRHLEYSRHCRPLCMTSKQGFNHFVFWKDCMSGHFTLLQMSLLLSKSHNFQFLWYVNWSKNHDTTLTYIWSWFIQKLATIISKVSCNKRQVKWRKSLLLQVLNSCSLLFNSYRPNLRLNTTHFNIFRSFKRSFKRNKFFFK